MSKFNQSVEVFSGEITKMEIQKKRKDRINIYLDLVYAFSCHVDLVFEFRLDKGKILTAADTKNLLEADDEKMAYSYGLRIALMRSVSVYDCRKKLKTYEFSPRSIDLAIDKLLENQFLDDGRFAQNFYEMKQNQYGRYRIQQELKRHGISSDLIRSTTAELADADQEYEEALKFATRKFESVGGVLDQKGYAKIYGFIARKGFSADVIRRVMSHLKSISKTTQEWDES